LDYSFAYVVLFSDLHARIRLGSVAQILLSNDSIPVEQ
jgi:hypothetical protein